MWGELLLHKWCFNYEPRTNNGLKEHDNGGCESLGIKIKIGLLFFCGDLKFERISPQIDRQISHTGFKWRISSWHHEWLKWVKLLYWTNVWEQEDVNREVKTQTRVLITFQSWKFIGEWFWNGISAASRNYRYE